MRILELVGTTLTGSTPTTTHFGLWAFVKSWVSVGLLAFLIARETPVIVPPVPAPATNTSTLSDEGLDAVDGAEIMALMISGPVVSS